LHNKQVAKSIGGGSAMRNSSAHNKRGHRAAPPSPINSPRGTVAAAGDDLVSLAAKPLGPERTRVYTSSPQQISPQAAASNKRVRVDYNGYAVRPDDDTPPLVPATAPRPGNGFDSMPMLPPPIPPRSGNGGSFGGDGMKRIHSLAFSDSSMMGELPSEGEEFVNPFEDETELQLLQQQEREPHRDNEGSNGVNVSNSGGGGGSSSNHRNDRLDTPNPVVTRESSSSSIQGGDSNSNSRMNLLAGGGGNNRQQQQAQSGVRSRNSSSRYGT